MKCFPLSIVISYLLAHPLSLNSTPGLPSNFPFQKVQPSPIQ